MTTLDETLSKDKHVSRYFNFNYNFLSRNRQEGVIMLDALIFMMLSFICWTGLFHLQSAALKALERVEMRLHALSCARMFFQNKKRACTRGCIITDEEVKEGEVVWKIVHVVCGMSHARLIQVIQIHQDQ